MKINLPIDVVTWHSPDFILCEIDGSEFTIGVSDLPRHVTELLIRQWVDELCRKIGVTAKIEFAQGHGDELAT